MKVTGIIAEYNPFHNGHAYQIQKAKEKSQADYIIVAMSGNYVQRGAPALLDKFSRTQAALKNGADFVFEIPSLWASASAEYFAAAGISLLHALGCVDTVSFGCETTDLSLMSKTAQLFAWEPPEYVSFLSDYLKQGFPFPSAREKAVISYFTQQKEDLSVTDLSFLLHEPNNILALEYMKYLTRNNLPITPLPVLRQGNGYHDTTTGEDFCSATAIRTLCLETNAKESEQENLKQTKLNTIFHYVPKETADLLVQPDSCFLTENNFSAMLYYKLLSEKEKGFAEYADSSPELSNRICRRLSGFRDYESFCKLLKSKEVTYTRISRLLLHILLNHKQSDYERAKEIGYIPYLRLLGFRKDASSLFTEIKKHALVPLITKPAGAASFLSQDAFALFEQDVFASDLYYGILGQKSGVLQKSEYQRGIVVV